MAVAGAGDPALLSPFAAGVPRGHQAEVAHQLRGALEAGQASELGCQHRRRDDADAPQRLQGLHQRLQAPRLDQLDDALREPRHPLAQVPHSAQVVLGHALMGLVGEVLGPDPLQVPARPGGLARIAPLMSQEELAELVARHALRLLGVVARPLQVAHRLRRLVGNVDLREVARPQEARQPHGARRSVFTRPPDRVGTSDGATTTQSMPSLASARCNPKLVGPAS